MATNAVLQIDDGGTGAVNPNMSVSAIQAIINAAGSGVLNLTLARGTYNWATGLVFNGLSSLVLNMDGATIICGGTELNSYVTPFVIKNCGFVSIQGGIVDYLNLPFAQGVCTAVDTTTCTLNIVTPNGSGGVQLPTFATIQRMIQNDPVTGYMNGVIFTYLSDSIATPYPFTQTGPTTWVISSLTPDLTALITVGNSYLVDTTPFGKQAINIADTQDFRLKDFTVHAVCGQAIFSNRVARTRIEKLVVEPPVGSGRWQSSNAAGYRSVLGGESIEMFDSRFLQGGDDCFNNSEYEFQISALSGNQFTIDTHQFQPVVVVGSYFWFSDTNGKLLLDATGNPYLGTVTTITGQNTANNVITFSGAAPPGLANGYFVFFTAYNPWIRIWDTRFAHNRGRGFVGTGANITLVNIDAEYTYYSAISVGSVYSKNFSQFAPAYDVSIINPKIVGCCWITALGSPGASVRTSPAAIEALLYVPLDFNRTLVPAGTGVRLAIQGGTMANVPTGGVVASGWDNLSIKGIHFHNVGTGNYTGFYQNAISFTNCSHVEVDANSAIVTAVTTNAIQQALPISSAVTITLASPCVVSWAASNLFVGTPIVFSTTNTLPMPLVAGTTYYVISSGLTTGSFQISATPNGSPISTTGPQSGVHTATASSFSFGVNTINGIGQTSTDVVYLGTNPGMSWIGDSSIVMATPATVLKFISPGVTTLGIDQTKSFYRFVLQASGGGGGGGAQQLTSNNASGGAGGAPGGVKIIELPVSVLGTSRNLSVGAGGAGGAAAATPSTNGGDGSAGNTTSISGLCNVRGGGGGAGGQIGANSGGGGSGGPSGAGTSGSGATAGTGNLSLGNGGSGAASVNTTAVGWGSGGGGGVQGGAGSKSGTATSGPSGGGAGGGISPTGPTANNGGDSGFAFTGDGNNNATGGAGSQTSAAVGAAGGNGAAPSGYNGFAFGGAGGGAGLTGGGAGGAGAQGSGGGGGGNAPNGQTPGAGGKGGDGAIFAIPF